MYDDEMLVIQVDIRLKPDKMEEFRQSIIRQKSEGVIVLPPYVHVLRAPSDVDVRVVDSNFTV